MQRTLVSVLPTFALAVAAAGFGYQLTQTKDGVSFAELNRIGALKTELVLAKASTHTLDNAKATEPILDNAKVTEPILDNAKAAEPILDGAKATEPILDSAKAAEPILDAVLF